MTIQRIKSGGSILGGGCIAVDRTGQIIRSGLFNDLSKQVQPLFKLSRSNTLQSYINEERKKGISELIQRHHVDNKID